MFLFNKIPTVPVGDSESWWILLHLHTNSVSLFMTSAAVHFVGLGIFLFPVFVFCLSPEKAQLRTSRSLCAREEVVDKLCLQSSWCQTKNIISERTTTKGGFTLNVRYVYTGVDRTFLGVFWKLTDTHRQCNASGNHRVAVQSIVKAKWP